LWYFYRINYNVNLIPYTLVVYLDKMETCCSCRTNIYSNEWCKAAYVDYSIENDNIIHDTEYKVVKLELDYCLLCCLCDDHIWKGLIINRWN